MKPRAYWVEVLERHEAAYQELLERKDDFGCSRILPLRGLPRKARQRRSRHNIVIEEQVRVRQFEDQQILKLERLIAYARDRIAAIEAQTIFDRLRRGGLSI